MSDLDPLSRYQVGSAVLNGLACFFTGGVLVGSLFLCRRSMDRARNVTRWLKVSLLFMTLFTFLFMVNSVIYLVYFNTSSLGSGMLSIFSTLVTTFQIIAKTLVLATLSSLARGILFARSGKRPSLALPVAIVTYAVVAINIVLSIAYLGLLMRWRFADYDDFDSDESDSIILHINRLQAVPMIFVFIGSVVSLAASVLTFIKVQSKFPTLKMASIVYVSASFMFFISGLFEVIFIGVHLPLSFDDFFAKSNIVPDGMVLITFFFGVLPVLVPLIAIVNLTRTKGKGLWTVQAGAPGSAFVPKPGAPQGQFQGQPMQQNMQQPMQGQTVPGQAPVQGQWTGYQPGMAPQGAWQPTQPQGIPQQGWQPTNPQPGYYYPQGQQPAPPAQYNAAQTPSPAPAPSEVPSGPQSSPPQEMSSHTQHSPPQEMSSHTQQREPPSGGGHGIGCG